MRESQGILLGWLIRLCWMNRLLISF